MAFCDNIPAYKSSNKPVHKLPLTIWMVAQTNLNYINIKDIKNNGGTWNASNVINGATIQE